MRRALVLLLLALVCACGGTRLSDERPTPPLLEVPEPPEAIHELLAFTAEGDLALVDGASGAILARSKGAGLTPRELVFDRWMRRAITFEGDDDDGGELASRTLDRRGTPGPRVPLAPVDGDVRLSATPLGPLVFEEGYGHRWRVVRNDGAFRSSVLAALPTSVWVDESLGLTLHALVHDEARAAWGLAVARLDSELTVSVEPLALALTDSARLLPTRMVEIVIDAGPTFLRLERHLLASTTVIAPGEARVAYASALEGGAIAIVLTEPAILHACALSPRGEVVGHDRAILEGRVDARARMFTRAIAEVARRRIVVATDAGLFAFELRGAGPALRLRRDETFRPGSLRGPIVVLD